MIDDGFSTDINIVRIGDTARWRPSRLRTTKSMATETVHIVQAYVQAANGAVRAEPQIGCKDAEEARRKAERLAPLRHGVVAFTVSADTELGDYDEEAAILFKAGVLPPPFDDG
ncbi:hypothetical protein D3C87_313080 [compost metagenome]|jgi:hypothetical protein